MSDDHDVTGVGVLILSLLAEQPSHPYQIFQTLEQRRETRLVRVNPGAIYHTVERLERDGLVAKVATERAGRRPLRTRYRITDEGRRLLADALVSFVADDHPPYPLVAVGLAEMGHLPLADAIAALEARRSRLIARSDWLEQTTRYVRDEDVPRRYVLELEYETVHVSAELSWISHVIADLAGGAIPWEEPDGLPVRLPSPTRLPSHGVEKDPAPSPPLPTRLPSLGVDSADSPAITTSSP